MTLVLKMCSTITGAMEPWFRKRASENSFINLWDCTSAHKYVAHWLFGSESMVALAAWARGTQMTSKIFLMHAPTTSLASLSVASEVAMNS